MACEGTSNDELITEAIMMRVVKDELEQVPAEFPVPPLPNRKPLPAKDEILTTQLAQTIKIIGDDLVKHKPLNDTIDGLAKNILANPQQQSIYHSISQVVSQVFADGINWGRIVVLFYTVAKLTGKMLLARLPEPVTEILSWTLNYFKKHLLQWVIKMGGWFCSIAPITCFRIESVPALFPPEPSSAPTIGITCFVGGIVLGGLVVLLYNGRTRH